MKSSTLISLALFGFFSAVRSDESCSPPADVCGFMRELAAMKESLKAINTGLLESERRHNTSEQQILNLYQKERSRVIFSAVTGGGGQAIGPFSTDTTVVYKEVFTNVGNAYNKDTGIFAPPVAGVYYFTFFYHAGGEHESKLFLYKNDQKMVMTHDHASQVDTADNGGNAVYLQLQRGDNVYVVLAAHTHIFGSSHHSTFSGRLVTMT
ncbi:unnamed protein product [Menidia menidia]|uniref:(Atlantic silverside) hypothetical protein n=1 Tax=Menidia menidia TaxID=238744 RepID=A0A8S4BT02_9TELE|nr:unnamed protein product [Menidia menidia]